MWTKMRFTILAVLITLNGCAIVNIRYERPYVDHSLRPYVDSFLAEATIRGHKLDASHLTVIFDDIKRTGTDMFTIGYCYDQHIHPTVIIDKEAFFRYNAMQREMLLFHELGHCLVHRVHCDAKDGPREVSIMATYVGDTSDYALQRDLYVSEIFSKDSRCN